MTRNLQKMYTQVPPTYEFLNHLLTFGLDVRWRKKAAKIAADRGGTYWLDIGIGTGEMAVNLHQAANDTIKVIALDFSLPMMMEAKKKQSTKDIDLILGEATRLPFPQNTFDVVTISFASRNIDSSGKGNLSKCFSEIHRILKPEGIFVNLETSQPRYQIIRWMFHLYVKLSIFPIGSFISGSRSAYRYLSQSIRKFYDPDEMANIMIRAGFKDVSYHRLLFGAAALHQASW